MSEEIADAVIIELTALSAELGKAETYFDKEVLPQAIQDRRTALRSAATQRSTAVVTKLAAQAAVNADKASAALEALAFDLTTVDTSVSASVWQLSVLPALEASGTGDRVPDWASIIENAGPEELAGIKRFAEPYIRRTTGRGLTGPQHDAQVAEALAGIDDAVWRRGIELNPEGPAALRAAESAHATNTTAQHVRAQLASGRVLSRPQVAALSLSVKTAALYR